MRCSAGFSQYSAKVPGFLHHRPRDVVKHVVKLLEDQDGTSQGNVKLVGIGEFVLNGKTRVHFGDESNYPLCECYDWQHTRLPCKHFCEIFSCVPGWGWDKLSPLYRDSPLLSLDEMCLSNGEEEMEQDCHNQEQPSPETSAAINTPTGPDEFLQNRLTSSQVCQQEKKQSSTNRSSCR